MDHAMPVVSFRSRHDKQRFRPKTIDAPFEEEVARFAAVDPRWRVALESVASRLSPQARCTLGVALSGFPTGRAPTLMTFGLEPDDDEAIGRETDHMDRKILAVMGMLTASRLGLHPVEIAGIRGAMSAVHRLLRIAKTRS